MAPAQMIPPVAYCRPTMYSGVPISAPPLIMLATTWIAPIKAKLEPRNTGTLRLVIRWNRIVPTPAQNSATEVSSPVSSGTSTVAPNMANTCWMPSSVICPQFFFVLSIPYSSSFCIVYPQTAPGRFKAFYFSQSTTRFSQSNSCTCTWTASLLLVGTFLPT